MSTFKIILKNSFKSNMLNEIKRTCYIKDINKTTGKFKGIIDVSSYYEYKNIETSYLYTIIDCKKISNWENYENSDDYNYIKQKYSDDFITSDKHYLYKNNIYETFLL